MSVTKINPIPAQFQFYTRVHLSELTGLKARSAKELVSHLKAVPDAVVYQHTHHFLKQLQFLSPEPPNDFAYWAAQVLNEKELGEKLASINTCEFHALATLREKIISTIENCITKTKRQLNEAPEGHEFHFIKSVSFIFQTPYRASTLEEFVASLKKVTVHSIYFHMFEAKLRLHKGVNDFSNWMESALGEKDLAKKISKLDPYSYTIEHLRTKMIHLIETRLSQKPSVLPKES